MTTCYSKGDDSQQSLKDALLGLQLQALTLSAAIFQRCEGIWMDRTNQNLISNIPEISAIYFALLQCGYDYYSIERGGEHNDTVRSFAGSGAVPSFFYGTKQNTCEVYPYWPRAAILETASFYLSPDHLQFREYDAFHERIMASGNILDCERDQKLWTWITEFPAALSQVLESDAYRCYMEWENRWIAEQNVKHEKELRLIQRCLDMCVSKYGSPVRDIQIVVNPIKCVYSADYHLTGDRFVFSSGDFRLDSVIHEFLHHVVHPVVVYIKIWCLKAEGYTRTLMRRIICPEMPQVNSMLLKNMLCED